MTFSAPDPSQWMGQDRRPLAIVILIFLLLSVSVAEGDRELALRLKRHDSGAMADLYDRFGRVAYSVIFTIVRDSGIAEDLVQETFLRVWNRMAAFDAERGALGPWLLTVARNRAIDHIRSAGARITRNAYELEEREHPRYSRTPNRRLSPLTTRAEFMPL